MNVYLAGPMRGYPNYNFASFTAMCRDLRRRGHVVVSPHEMDQGLDIDWDSPKFSTQVIYRDIDAVMAADAVVTLPGWEHSLGAQAEVAVARWAGMPVLSADVLIAHGYAQ